MLEHWYERVICFSHSFSCRHYKCSLVQYTSLVFKLQWLYGVRNHYAVLRIYCWLSIYSMDYIYSCTFSNCDHCCGIDCFHDFNWFCPRMGTWSTHFYNVSQLLFLCYYCYIRCIVFIMQFFICDGIYHLLYSIIFY